MNFARCLLFGLCVATVGCDSGPQEARGVRVVSWSTSSPDREPVGGIDEAQVSFATFGEKPAIVIWSDGGGTFGAGYDKTRRAVHYSGSLRAHDARTYPVEAFTADGKTGDVMIDGQRFDLAKGSLFLVKTGGGATTVKQLTKTVPIPVTSAENEAESAQEKLREYATANREISDFFEEAPALID
ncbi:MAG: hypothetical protein H0T47_09385 [Planctomycetaceae bacterium]|nr:hypothetical protein [Planctomycetaceae bacterium]